jgi:RNA polymerase sigma-70 factor, ECF subfamily
VSPARAWHRRDRRLAGDPAAPAATRSGGAVAAVAEPTRPAPAGCAAAAMQRYCDAGDGRAFAALYAIAAPRLRRAIRAVIRDRATADDVLQQTFLKLHRCRAAYLAGVDPLPWLHTIARRLCLDELRRARRARVTGPGALATLVDPSSVRRDGRDPASPTDPAIAAALRAVERLPEPHRRALILTKLDGKSSLEAAALLGTTPVAVRLRVHRGYKRLRAILDAYAAEA